MAFLRRFHTDLLAKDTVTGDTSVLGGAIVNVLRGGAVIKNTATLNASLTTITVYHPGLLRKTPGDNVRAYASGVMDAGWNIAITNIAYNATDNDWDLTVNVTDNGSGSDVALAAGDRLVLKNDSTGRVTLYNDETGTAPLTHDASNPTSDSTSGSVQFYAKEPFVDLEISKSGSTTRHVLGVHGEGSRDPVTPQDFGAAADGSTDDTTSVQSAIHYVGELLGGGEVFIPSTTASYKLTDELPLYSNMVIRGEGPDSHLNQTTSSKDVFAASGITQTTISRIGLTTTSGAGFDIDGTNSDLTIMECTAVSITGGAFIDLNVGAQNRVINNNLRQVASGINFSGAVTDSVIAQNTFNTCTGATITLSATTARCMVALNVLNDGTPATVTDSGTDNVVALNTGDVADVLDTDLHNAKLTVGDFVGTVETEAPAGSTITINDDTTIIYVNAANKSINSISGCAAGRFLHVTARGVTGTCFTLVNNNTGTGTDNEFFLPNEEDLVLTDGDGVLLVGHEQTFNGASAKMWTVAGMALGRSYATMYLASAGAGVNVTGGTPGKDTSGTAAAGVSTKDWTITTTSGGKITYDGVDSATFRITVYAAVESSSAGAALQLKGYIAINGSAAAESEIDRDLTANSISGALAMGHTVVLAPSSYVEIYWDHDNTSNPENVQVNNYNIFVEKLR